MNLTCKKKSMRSVMTYGLATVLLILLVIVEMQAPYRLALSILFLLASICVAESMWWLAKAKGYSGFIGIALLSLTVVGLLVLLVIPENRPADAVSGT